MFKFRNLMMLLSIVAMVASLGLFQGCSNQGDNPIEPLKSETITSNPGENSQAADSAILLADSTSQKGERQGIAASAATWPAHITHFKWPVVRNQLVRINAGYGPGGGSPYHKGHEYYAVDLINGDSPKDTRWMWVINPARGVVKSTGYSTSRGWYVIMDHHNGWESRIYHLQTDPRVFIHVGDDLLQGTFLGYTGSSGWATGPHIHFVILHNGWSVPLNGIDGDYDLRIGWNYCSSNDYVRPPRGNP